MANHGLSTAKFSVSTVMFSLSTVWPRYDHGTPCYKKMYDDFWFFFSRFLTIAGTPTVGTARISHVGRPPLLKLCLSHHCILESDWVWSFFDSIIFQPTFWWLTFQTSPELREIKQRVLKLVIQSIWDNRSIVPRITLLFEEILDRLQVGHFPLLWMWGLGKEKACLEIRTMDKGTTSI